jgi:hypothetical protein
MFYIYIYFKKQKSYKYMSVLCSYLHCHLKYSSYILTEVDLGITKEAWTARQVFDHDCKKQQLHEMVKYISCPGDMFH